MFDRKKFFDVVRHAPFEGTLSHGQVDGLNNILDEWERRKLAELRWLANMLAQTYHETAATMQPIREHGSEAYLRGKPYYPWVGMGLIQVTWEHNARKFGATRPEDLLAWPVALRALFDGMITGMFTGKKLADYFNERIDDPYNARRIVNGLDRAAEIASYHAAFLSALKAASTGDPPKTIPVVETLPPAPQGGFFNALRNMFKRG
jgi:hypothetical protein